MVYVSNCIQEVHHQVSGHNLPWSEALAALWSDSNWKGSEPDPSYIRCRMHDSFR